MVCILLVEKPQIDQCRVQGQGQKPGSDNRLITWQELKADRPHPRNYPPTLTDYKHTDNHLRLVMVVVAVCCSLGKAERKQTDGQTDATNSIISLLCGR